MPDFGNNSEPGILTDLESATGIGVPAGAPGVPCLVGQADLANGSASANEAHEITRISQARSLFGEGRMLTGQIIDALNAGASNVIGVAASKTDVTGEDLSGLASYTGTLANAPVTEDPSEVTFTINSTTMTSKVTYRDPAQETPGADEVYYNPVNGKFHIDNSATLGSAGDDVDYSHFDYDAALEAAESEAAEGMDFLAPIMEKQSVVTKALNVAESMAKGYNFALVLAGAFEETALDGSDNFSAPANAFDDYRLQLVYPVRNADGRSVIGSYAGKRAEIGINTTPINKRLKDHRELIHNVALPDRGSLINDNIVPLAQESAGARIADDVNTVSSSNTENPNIQFGTATLIVDVVARTVYLNEQPYVGKFHKKVVRQAFRDAVDGELKSLRNSDAIIDYTIAVDAIDSTTAALDLAVDVAEPLRFIENTITVGDIN